MRADQEKKSADSDLWPTDRCNSRLSRKIDGFIITANKIKTSFHVFMTWFLFTTTFNMKKELYLKLQPKNNLRRTVLRLQDLKQIM